MRKLIRYNVFMESMSDNVINQLLSKEKITPFMVNVFKLMDPTKNKRWIGWIAKQYLKDPDTAITHDVKELLDRYLHYVEHNLTKQKDINRFRNIESLEKHVKELSHLKTTRELRKEKSLIFENEYIAVYRPTSNESCRQLVFGVLMDDDIYPKWCIIPKNSLEWNNYWINKKFTFYIIRLKKLPEEYTKDSILVNMFNNVNYRTLIVAIHPSGQVDHIENKKPGVTERHLNEQERKSIINKKWGSDIILKDILVPYNTENRK